MKTLLGNTYPIKDEIKAAGGKFAYGLWSVPEDKHEQLQSKLGTVKSLCSYLKYNRPAEIIQVKSSDRNMYYDKWTSPINTTNFDQISKITAMEMCSDIENFDEIFQGRD